MYQFKVQTEFANGSVLESPFSEEIEIHARPNFTTITSATSNFNVPRRADIWVQSDPNTYLSITSAVIESSSGKTRTYTWYSVEWSHFAVDMPFYTAQETTTGTYNYRVTIYNEFGSVTSPWFNNVNLPY